MILAPSTAPRALVLDTSALVAVLRGEPESTRIEPVLVRCPRVLMSAATRVEAGMLALGRYGEEGVRGLDALLRRLDVDVQAVTREQGELAFDAFRRFGKGRHPAALNFGDCFAYALARSLDVPLLCKGDDFARTDLRLVEY